LLQYKCRSYNENSYFLLDIIRLKCYIIEISITYFINLHLFSPLFVMAFIEFIYIFFSTTAFPGGGLTIAFDRDALEEYLHLNPSLQTVDDLSIRILLSDVISKEDRNRCNITFSLLDEGDLFIAFEAKSRADDYCMKASERVSKLINDLPEDASTSVAVPQVRKTRI